MVFTDITTKKKKNLIDRLLDDLY